MVNTRSQVNRENRTEQPEVDRFADDEDNIRVSDHYSGSYFSENDEETMKSIERGIERFRIEQRLQEMNKQIEELTSMVRALTEKMTNSRNENDQDARNIGTSYRSDNHLSS